MKEIIKQIYQVAIASIYKELPLFLLSVFFLNPIWIGMLKNAPLEAIKRVFCVDNIISCDLYTTLLCAWIIVLLCSIVPAKFKNAVKIVIYLLLISSFCIKKYMFNVFHVGFTADILTLVLETTPKESMGFAKTYLNNSTCIRYILLVALSIIGVFAFEYGYKRKCKNLIGGGTKNCILCLIFIFCVIAGLLSSRKYFELESYPECNTYTSLRYSLLRLMETRSESEAFWKNMKEIDAQENVAQCAEDSINVIFILGESFQKWHASLYGYDMPTTPIMKEEKEKGNLFAFEDMVTSYALTTPAMHSIMCLNSISDGEKWFEGAYFPQLFHKAGFDVYMWDSWKDDTYRYNNSFFEIYTPTATDCWLTDENRNTYSYDYDFVKDFITTVSLKSRRNLIIYHQIGSHFAYKDKYPEEEAVFSACDVHRSDNYLTTEKKQLISEYDNSIRMTDKTFGLLADTYRNTNSVIVFLSDHGDEVYDYRDNYGRPAMDENKKSEYAHCLYDVPAFVWVSDKYIQSHPALIKDLKTALHRKGSSDRIGYSVMRLAGISSGYYKPERDILSERYQAGKRKMFFNSFNRRTHRVSSKEDNWLDYDSMK